MKYSYAVLALLGMVAATPDESRAAFDNGVKAAAATVTK
jgi:hypothetical protein